MAAFTVRIMLHEADWNDYEKLHSEMEKQGFDRTITSNDGVTYQLPDAEYDISGDISQSDVLAKAKTAANQTKMKYAVLVTQSAGRIWFGLDKV